MANATSKSRTSQKQGRLSFGSSASPQREYAPFTPTANPNLEAFVADHATQYDQKKDRYDVQAFERDIVVDKAAPPKAIYDMHTYWSKKHWAAIREYIRHYLPERYYPRGTGLVLDCFSGSGMSGVAAVMEDRPCVLIDASPAAAFISHCYTHPVAPADLQAAYEQLVSAPYDDRLKKAVQSATGEPISTLGEELEWLYSTKCDRCGGDATTEYVVYSDRYQCPACAEVVALFDCPEGKVPYPVGGKRAQRTELKQRRLCPHCLARSHNEPHRDFVISTRGKKFGPVPVLVRYRCQGSCRPAVDERRSTDDGRSRKGRYFREHDLAKIDQMEAARLPHWVPERDLWKALPYRLGYKKDFRPTDAKSFADLYSKRNLWALAAFRAATQRLASTMSQLQISLTVPAITCSRMLREEKRAVQTGTYYIPPVSRHINLSNAVEYGQRVILAGQEALWDLAEQASVLVSSESAAAVALPDNCLDYIFTDPAYVDKIQYGELNLVWESWLGFDGAWLDHEIVVNPFRNKTIEAWERDLRRAFSTCYRALKPGRWMSICYHDTDPGTWALLQNMLLDTGFEIETVTVLDPKQKSNNQVRGEKVVKSDLVVNCRKPKPGEKSEAGDEDTGSVSHRVREILIEALSHTAGQTRDRLWDTVLKRLLSRGLMAEHRFDDILSQVAFRSESGRWFLREEFESLSENDIKNEEHAGDALVRFTRLRMTGVPAALASDVVARAPRLAEGPIDEKQVEKYVRDTLFKDRKESEKFALGGRLKGAEFYDCLFFYLTRWLKGRAAGKTPRRNLAEFLDEYLVRFKDGDKWLHRAPDEAEAQSLKKARQTGLGRRIRQYIAFLLGEGEFPAERMPDAKTLVAWLKHCAAFGLADEGALLWEKGGLIGQLGQLSEDDRYDAEDYYTQCKRRAAKSSSESDDAQDDESESEEGADE